MSPSPTRGKWKALVLGVVASAALANASPVLASLLDGQPRSPPQASGWRCATTTAPAEATAPTLASSAVRPAAATAGAGVSQVVTVVVPSIAMVRVGADGAVLAVATNTGSSPQPTDHFAVWDSETGRSSASACVRAAVLASPASVPAPWASGEWHDLEGRPTAAP